MAYGVRWIIEFAARNQDLFRIEVLQNNYNDEAVRLRGAESPIETEEDNSDYLFMPIRKQTGTLRIMDDGYDLDGNEFNYLDMIPSSKFDNLVKLWQVGTTDTLRWIGYMCPESLTSRVFETAVLREFQLVCPLGQLYKVPLSFSNTDTDLGSVKTMGQILHAALSCAEGVAWNTVYKQNNVHGREDLIATVSLINFVTENKPTHTTPQSELQNFTATWKDDNTSWGSVLESVCTFWGWTLYSRGLNIYIIAQFQNLPFTQFQFCDLLSTANTQLPDIAYNQIDFNDLNFASTDNTECRKLGYRNVKVTSDVNENAEVINPDYDRLNFSFWTDDQQGQQIVHSNNDYLYVVRRLGPDNSSTQYIDNYQIHENRLLQTLGNTAPFVLMLYEGWQSAQFANVTSFSFNRAICCWIGGQNNRITFFARTMDDVCIPSNSVICIDAACALTYDADADSGSEGQGQAQLEGRTFIAAIKVGNYYWDNYNKIWTTTSTNFGVSVRADGSITMPQNEINSVGIPTQGVLFDNHAGSKGFCLYNPNGAVVCGRMTISIYSTASSEEPTTQTLNLIIKNLTVSIYNQDWDVQPQNKAEHEYKDVASESFDEDLSVNLQMASGNKNTYGRGQLFNPDLTMLVTVPFRTATNEYQSIAPEVRLLQRLKGCYGSVQLQNTIEIMDNIDASLPNASVTGHWATIETFRPMCVSHNWVNGTMKLTLVNR